MTRTRPVTLIGVFGGKYTRSSLHTGTSSTLILVFKFVLFEWVSFDTSFLDVFTFTGAWDRTQSTNFTAAFGSTK